MAVDTMDVPEDKWPEVLAALVNAARPVGMGVFIDNGERLTVEDAAILIKQQGGWFDYVFGRPIKIIFQNGTVRRLNLYDRDQGAGLGELIVRKILSGGTE